MRGILTRSIVAVALALTASPGVVGQRRVTPVEAVIPGADDASNRAALNLLTDTLTADTASRVPPMRFALWHSVSLGLNVWDGAMRLFGQHYGVGDVWASLSMHNRYIAVAAVGLGLCDDTPSGANYRYRSPLAPYFKIGFDYNFFYNSNPAYCLLAGLRYGLSAFSYSVDDVTVEDSYWDESAGFDIPSQHATAGYLELSLGLRVKIAGPVSLGWNFLWHKILHEGGAARYGRPVYIPGYGKRGGAVTGAFSVIWTLELNKAPSAAL